MAVFRTPLNILVSSVTRQTVEPFNGFRSVERAKILKSPTSGKTAFICVATLILSALAGAITPWVLAGLAG